jgi:hypothetical protein
MRVIPSAATCVSGLVGFVASSVFLKNCHRGIYTKFAFFGSDIPPISNNLDEMPPEEKRPKILFDRMGSLLYRFRNQTMQTSSAIK